MNRATLFGAAYSVYVRIPRLVLAEIGVPYDLVEVDIFTKESIPADFAERHPFGRIPAFEHDGFRLFETDAIVGYILDRFGDHGLVPSDIQERARMRQIMRIMDNYGYRALVWGVYVEELERNRADQLRPDELALARRCLHVLANLATSDFLASAHVSLADLWAQPMLAYLRLAPTGRALLRETPKLEAWLERMEARPSVAATRFPAETQGR
jgi:glutathione S-transferase